MIISRAEIESAMMAYRTARKRTSKVASTAYEASDSYEVSDGSAALSAFASQALSDPFYRAPLVADIGSRIAEGNYFVPAEQIVEKLIGRLFAEALPA